MMIRLIYFELIKTFTRLRTYIGFIAFGLIVPLVVTGLRLGGTRTFERNLLSVLQNDFVIGGNVLNGWFFGFFFMGALWIHVPIVLTIVAGDQIAGEGNAGTLRFLLTHAVSRTRIMVAKFIVTLIYTAAMVFFIGGLTLGLSLWVFGGGDLLDYPGGNPCHPGSPAALPFPDSLFPRRPGHDRCLLPLFPFFGLYRQFHRSDHRHHGRNHSQHYHYLPAL